MWIPVNNHGTVGENVVCNSVWVVMLGYGGRSENEVRSEEGVGMWAKEGEIRQRRKGRDAERENWLEKEVCRRGRQQDRRKARYGETGKRGKKTMREDKKEGENVKRREGHEKES